MRIVFFCGGLEPGRDGVGDYSRRLACELRKHGHKTFIVSLNDLFISVAVKEIQYSGIIDVPTLRLSSTQSWEVRMGEAKSWIDEIDPEWLSLQYVLYSFHPKGLPYSLGRSIQPLGIGRKWHIMFHELWLGIKKDAPFSHYIYGFFQKRLIRTLIKNLSPAYITTSNRIYQLELQKIGSEAAILMLFSNIPMQEKDENFIRSIYQQLGIENESIADYLFLGVFSSLSDSIDYEQVVQEQLLWANGKGKNLAFVHFGRAGNAEMLEKVKHTFQNKVRFVSLGELSDRQVSSVLQVLDVGISSTPKEYLGKSGVYAAMRLHGLRVLVFSGMVIPQYKNEIEIFNERLERREWDKWDVKYIAQEFYENIRLHTDL